MKRFLFLLALSLASACSNAPSRYQTGADKPGAANGSNGGASGSNEGGGVIGGENSAVPITYAPSPGSAMRLIDGRALTIIYQRIFPARDYGFEICKGNANFRELSDCSESMFTPDERPFVGTIDIFTPRLNRGPQNLRQPEDLTLNYMRTVRVGLSRECEALVTREHAAFLQNKSESNILVKAEKPTKAVVEEFFRRILGIEGTAIPVEFGVSGYLEAFSKYTEGKTDVNTTKQAYYGLCIAVAMDPQVFIY
jgi:hypothetical protein